MVLYDVRHHTDMHCFVEGTIVIERNDPYKMERVVFSIMGYYKDGYIQLDNNKSPWEYVENFRKPNPGEKTWKAG